jgi:hypothetical protein
MFWWVFLDALDWSSLKIGIQAGSVAQVVQCLPSECKFKSKYHPKKQNKTIKIGIHCIKEPSFSVSKISIFRGWWNGSNHKNACLASMRPWVQTPVLPQKNNHFKITFITFHLFQVSFAFLRSMCGGIPKDFEWYQQGMVWEMDPSQLLFPFLGTHPSIAY